MKWFNVKRDLNVDVNVSDVFMITGDVVIKQKLDIFIYICFWKFREKGWDKVSKILVPFVYHENIDHQFYLAKEYRIKKPGHKNFDSSMFRTGIIKKDKIDFTNSYLMLIDLIMLYDEVYISVDDLIYL